MNNRPQFLVLYLVSAGLLATFVHGSERPAGVVVQWGGEFGSARPATNVVIAAGEVLNNVVAIAGGGSHGLALKSNGTVIGWGNNNTGQAVGVPTHRVPYLESGFVRIDGRVLTNATAIVAGGGRSLALKDDGTVVTWGDGSFNQASVPVGSGVVAISAGWDRSLALKKDGTVVAWGERGGRPARVPDGLSNVVAIAASGPSSGRDLALRRDGTAVEWVSRGIDEGEVAGLSNAVAIASGEAHSLALKADSTVFGWGANNVGQATGVPTLASPYFSQGTVTVSGQVLTNVIAIAAAGQYSLGLKKDGTVVAWGESLWRTTEVPSGLSNVTAIAASEGFCLAITTNPAVAAQFAHPKR